MSYHLICEGRCNPQRAEIDARVERLRYSLVGEHVALDGESTLGRQVRALRYTPHECIDINRVQCQTCGHVRHYPN
jgi:hypothetical protein